MMPKGVEHSSIKGISSSVERVKIPMMPKGVEHQDEMGDVIAAIAIVKIPMMPKGVEH